MVPGLILACFAFHRYVAFLELLNRAVRGRSLTDTLEETKIIGDLIALMDVMDKWVDETPPVDQKSRFGNFAFRTWHALLKENSVSLVSSVLANKSKEAAIELAPYLEDGFGNATRIDYGTGMPNWQVGILLPIANTCLILLFVGHERLEPSSFVEEETARTFAKQYMFMACIHHINTVKAGPFAEHSNQLWNISGVYSWRKMNEGLLRMYIAEVLRKFPVVQHFVFGTLLSIEPETTGPSSTAEALKGRLLENFTTVLCSSFFHINGL
ncbi:phosphotyrosyl phosphate activator protein [Trichuris suis]|nr:phosphotyrosyl phosphate activator protein [Trichuris suis]